MASGISKCFGYRIKILVLESESQPHEVVRGSRIRIEKNLGIRDQNQTRIWGSGIKIKREFGDQGSIFGKKRDHK